MPGDMQNDCKVMDLELDRQLSGQSLSAQARHHLANCPRCRSLYAVLETRPAMPPLPSEVIRRITANVEKTLTPVKPLKSVSALSGQVLVLFTLLGIALASVTKLVGIEAMSAGQMLGMSTLFALGVVLLSSSLARQMIPGSPLRFSAFTAVGAIGVAVCAGFLFLFPWTREDAFFDHGWHCFRAGMMVALPSSGMFWLVARRGAPLNLTALGATVGAAAGLLAVMMLQFTCDLQNTGHLLIWHGGVLALAIASGLVGYFVETYGSRGKV